MISSCPDAIFRAAALSFRQIYSQLSRQPPSFLKPRFAADDVRYKVWSRRDRFFDAFDFNNHADDFNHAFFLKNLFKGLLAISVFRSTGCLDDRKVVDVGSGAGSLAVAWNELFRLRGSTLQLVDTSETQLRSARTVLELLRVSKYELRCEDFLTVGPTVSGTRLAGYWACSQQDRDAGAIRSCLAAEVSLVIDYRHVLDFVGELLKPSCDRIDLRLRRIPLPVRNPQLFSDHEINLSASLFLPKDRNQRRRS